MWGLVVIATLVCVLLGQVDGTPVSFLEQGQGPVYYGQQPLENFHDMFPPFGMSHQPLSQLPLDHPANQLGRREHADWAGRYPQQWANPFPHNSPVDTSRIAKGEEQYPGRAVAPFWWNRPPWWWEEGPWWLQKVKRHNDGRPYGVLGDGPFKLKDSESDKPTLPSPISEFHRIMSGTDAKSTDVPTTAEEDTKNSSPTEQNDAILQRTIFGQRQQDKAEKEAKANAGAADARKTDKEDDDTKSNGN